MLKLRYFYLMFSFKARWICAEDITLVVWIWWICCVKAQKGNLSVSIVSQLNKHIYTNISSEYTYTKRKERERKKTLCWHFSLFLIDRARHEQRVECRTNPWRWSGMYVSEPCKPTCLKKRFLHFILYEYLP